MAGIDPGAATASKISNLVLLFYLLWLAALIRLAVTMKWKWIINYPHAFLSALVEHSLLSFVSLTLQGLNIWH